MPSIFVLSGPRLDGASTHFPSRILSPTPSLRGALGAWSLSAATANLWIGIALGAGGYWAADKYGLIPKKKPSGDVAGPRLGRLARRRRRRR